MATQYERGSASGHQLLMEDLMFLHIFTFVNGHDTNEQYTLIANKFSFISSIFRHV